MTGNRKSRSDAGVRIIAGRWRGRRIPVRVAGVRPTGDRIRETLFNWLQPHVAGARCLDLFAGTGALGLEALSRGAASAVFVERDTQAARQIKTNLATLQAETAATVIKGDARKLGLSTLGTFDLVFLDPPFDEMDADNLCTLLETSGVLASPAHVYLEMSRNNAIPELPSGWQVLRERTAGRVRFALLERTTDQPQE